MANLLHLLHFNNNVYEILDSDFQTNVIYTDFAETFDSVDLKNCAKKLKIKFKYTACRSIQK